MNITIFGGTGDLTFRKLLPALYMMDCRSLLSEDSQIVIIGRRNYENDTYRREAKDWIEKFSRMKCEEETYHHFAQRIQYFKMDFTDIAAYPSLSAFYQAHDIHDHIFYYAVAPRFFAPITEGLKTIPGTQTGKVILEKPFGETLASAKELNEEMVSYFGKDRIYRIDHYLGKEMVRNLQTIRFYNQVFANVWDHNSIDSVQISALEDVGVETRGGYYDTSGALKDMVQNHLFQILTVLAMEKPDSFTADDIHKAQQKVLEALHPITTDNLKDSLILGQYEGYQQEPKVDPASKTETFACLKIQVDNERWKGTPFYIRTGKKTGVRETEIAVVFHRPSPEAEPNVLLIKVQPTEGIVFKFSIKQPGETENIIPVKMDFCQSCNIEYHRNTPEAYERLLTACMNSDQAWFSQWDQIEASWRFIDSLKALAVQEDLPVLSYAQGTPGPKQAQDITDWADSSLNNAS